MIKPMSATSFWVAVVVAAILCASNVVFAALDDNYFACVQQNENKGGTPATKNSLGYLGNYQLGVPAAIDAGICSPTGLSGNDWLTCDFNGPLAKSLGLTGTQAERYAQFTTGSNAAAYQKAAAQAYSDATWRYLKNDMKKRGVDLESLITSGTSKDGVPLTRETVQAMMHLVGHVAAADYLAFGTPAKDANGMTPQKYAGCLSNCIASSSGGTSAGECSFKYNGACSAFAGQ